MHNMFKTPQNIRGISHPLIADIYLKADTRDREKNILVIEAKKKSEAHEEDNYYDSHVIDILTDIESLKEQAEQQIGSFDRIDIRTH